MKSNIIILSLSILLLQNTIMAQEPLPNKLIVTYSEKINLPKEILNSLNEKEKILFSNTNYNLKIDNKLFKSSYLIKESASNSFETESENKKSITKIAEYATYKDFLKNELLIRTELFDMVHIIENKIHPQNWNITNQKKNIGGFECKKAVLEIDGSKIVAYYTDKIPISEGPSKYYGLPGLIIKLETKVKNYLAIKVKYDDTIKINKFTKGKRISEKEYKKIMDEFKKKPVFYEEKNEKLEKVEKNNEN